MSEFPPLAQLEWWPYLSDRGLIPESLQGKVGVYAIFDADRQLQYIGYSRDVALSLRQHLVRCPQHCYWLKVQTIERPSRTVLESIRDAWMAENGAVPMGNGDDAAQWNQPIDVKTQMTGDEQALYATAIDEVAKTKALKQAARRLEAEVLEALRDRGVTEDIRFNPKLKETGLLDLK